MTNRRKDMNDQMPHPPFVLFYGGPPPAGSLNMWGQLYDLFAPVGVIPELIVHATPAMHEDAPHLASRHGRVYLDYYGSGRTQTLWRIARHMQLQNLLVRPSPREIAGRIESMGNPRVLIVIGTGLNIIPYSLKVLRLAPQLKATIYVDQEVSACMSSVPYRNPVTKRAIVRALAQLVRRCDRRFVFSEPLSRYYEERFEVPFDVLLPVVRDDHFQEFGKAAPPRPDPDGEFRVFLSGSMSELYEPSLRCLARAFDHVSKELGKPPRLVFSGTWTSERLQQLGFGADHLEGLGWQPSKHDLLKRASEADCIFLTWFLDESLKHYETTLWGFPVRVSESLIAGPPTVVHASPRTSIARYFEESHLPFLCQDMDEHALAAKLVQVARLSSDEKESIRRRYLSLAERSHLASKARVELVGETGQ